MASPATDGVPASAAAGRSLTTADPGLPSSAPVPTAAAPARFRRVDPVSRVPGNVNGLVFTVAVSSAVPAADGAAPPAGQAGRRSPVADGLTTTDVGGAAPQATALGAPGKRTLAGGDDVLVGGEGDDLSLGDGGAGLVGGVGGDATDETDLPGAATVEDATDAAFQDTGDG